MAGWETFYVIVGSSGAALIGIQFVVMTLVANMRERPPADVLNAFGTPTVVHFSSALLISAIMGAPWPSLRPAAIALVIFGAGGVGYGLIVIRRVRRQTFYAPVWQDWLWYVLLPCSVYFSLAVTALFLRTKTHTAPFVVAAAALALLLIGIHNAWDSVTHLIVVGSDVEDTHSE